MAENVSEKKSCSKLLKYFQDVSFAIHFLFEKQSCHSGSNLRQPKLMHYEQQKEIRGGYGKQHF
jgi:hypothetical protein